MDMAFFQAYLHGLKVIQSIQWVLKPHNIERTSKHLLTMISLRDLAGVGTETVGRKPYETG